MTLYSRLLQNALLPCHNLVRGRHYVRHRRFLERSQWWSSEELKEFQWREVTQLFRHVWDSVPYYQKKYREAGIGPNDLRSWDDWNRLPILKREEINPHREELCAQNFPGKLSPHATGGSSGVPVRFYMTDESYDWRTAATQRAYSWSGCTLGEKALHLWGGPVGEVPKAKAWKAKLHETIQRQLIINTFRQNDERWSEIYDVAVQYQPRLLVGYVLSLREFSRFLTRSGKRLPGVRSVIAAAEPLFPDVREEIERAIGAPVYNTYGSREFMSIAAECDRHEGLHINCENILLETLSKAGGGASELLVTDLHNYGMPFLRYTIGDVGALDTTPCACGRGLPRLQALDGRTVDVLRTVKGDVIPLPYIRHILKDIPEIEEYQVEQKRLESIVLTVVLSRPVSAGSSRLLDSELRKVFGVELQLDVRPVSQIPLLASGKQRAVIGLPDAS